MNTDYFDLAERLKAMAHPLRLQILSVLRSDAECVCHLSAALDKPQPYISQQLAILRNAGVIVDERAGANVFYRIASVDIARQVAAALDPLSADNPEGRRIVCGCSCPKCLPRAEAQTDGNCEEAIPALEESRKS
jgi:ArsR family transcriptional regulator